MAIRRLFTRLRQRHGLAATIRRGGAECEATVRRGRPERRATESQGVVIDSDHVDWLIARSEYEPTGSVSEPEVGDLITVTLEDESETTYRVHTPANAAQCFGFSDLEETELRVHCQTYQEG